MVGYATINAEGFDGTTGGEGGLITFASTLDEIHKFVKDNKGHERKMLVITQSIESPESFQFKFKNGSNLTIRGQKGVRLKNFGFYFDNYNNVIIENLIIHEVFYPNDPITINNSHHFCIRNNELYSIHNENIHKDTYDGLIDMKRGTRYVTIDSNYLHDHNKCLLIGHTDDISQKELDSKICVTICNNRFKNIETRCPSIRYGKLHVFNNIYEDIPRDYAIAARCGAQVLIENNVFINVKVPISYDGYVDGKIIYKFDGTAPKIKMTRDNKSFGLVKVSGKFIRRFRKALDIFNDCGFKPPYKYYLI